MMQKIMQKNQQQKQDIGLGKKRNKRMTKVWLYMIRHNTLG